MKIYVAGKWEDKERVREVQQQLRDAGHTITYDWTTQDEGIPPNEAALNDIEGVWNCDAYVGVFEKDLAYCGAMAELGMAAFVGMPIYLLGDKADRCIFVHVPQVRRGIGELLGEAYESVSN